MRITKNILIAAIAIVSFLTGAFYANAQESTNIIQANQAKGVDGYQYLIKFTDHQGLADFSLLSIDSYEEVFASSQNSNLSKVFKFNSSLSLQELKSQLKGKFAYLEYNKVVSTAQTNVESPDDPGFSNDPGDVNKQWALHKAKFMNAWPVTKGSESVVIAVIDTGVDASHEDLLAASIIRGYDVLTQSVIQAKSDSDDNGHGTLVSGIIAAAHSNEIGIAGAAPNVSIMPVKALTARGEGTSAEVAEAIVAAVDKGADIINLSLGGSGFLHDSAMGESIAYAYNHDVTVVSAAGNDVAVNGGNLDFEPVFPICNDNGKNMVIGVTASDINDLKPNFANYGKSCIDVSAPGKRILTTASFDPATGIAKPNSYAYASGTSMAVPFVSAQAALLKSAFPKMSSAQIRDLVISTADQIDQLNLTQCGGFSCAGMIGKGRINAEKSVSYSPPQLSEQSIVQVSGQKQMYLISSGRRLPISDFVLNQKYSGLIPKAISQYDLDLYPEGPFVAPLDGTLVKSSSSPAVYYVSGGLRQPILYQVFMQRGLSFDKVATLSDAEINSWVVGSFLPPSEGALVKTINNPTVYWTVSGLMHPISFRFWQDKGLNIFPLFIVSDQDLPKFAKGEPYF